MSKKDEVLDSMRGIIDPDLGRDIVELGFIKDLEIDDGTVGFTVELTTPACPVKEMFREQCTQAVNAIPWVDNVTVELSAAPVAARSKDTAPGLKQVRHIIAVASCKGGVGKSTVAVNLAFTLANQGAQVGIFDADIYGPSLPTMVQADFDGLFQKDGLILPVTHRGLKLMSFAYMTSNQESGPAIMRGPMVSQVVSQLLTTTNWGALDYLVLDLPPGTGDIQLTICQLVPLTAAVMVTTPQDISFIDVVKGIQMFDKLNVPTVAVVENMSGFVCGNCGEHHEIFGRGAMRRLVEQFGFENAFSIPIHPDITRSGDSGRPIVTWPDADEITANYAAIGRAVVREVSKVAHGGIAQPEVRFDSDSGTIVFKPVDGDETSVTAQELRRRCRCARCIHELTGESLLDPGSVADDITASNLQPLGNYAIALDWSDGHNSIYPYATLAEMDAWQEQGTT